MKDVFVFGMGFVSGWATRMSVGSFREGALDLIAAGYKGAERLKFRVETEREFLQDLIAEGRARYEAERGSSDPRCDSEVSQETDDRSVRAA